jgi:glutaredoxin 2
MGFGFLGVTYESIVLPYNDEQTPLNLTGLKMLPIVEESSTIKLNESLEILKKWDSTNQLSWETLENQKNKIELLISKIGAPVHSLCMPYWIWTPEFNPDSRQYFQSKKELKRGHFKNLILKKNVYLEELNSLLSSLIEPQIQSYYQGESLTIIDIMIAAHLWGMYIFPEFQFSPKMHSYLQRVSTQTHFNYHEDFWK